MSFWHFLKFPNFSRFVTEVILKNDRQAYDKETFLSDLLTSETIQTVFWGVLYSNELKLPVMSINSS